MLTNRWKQIEQVFNQALEVPVNKRISFVENACGADDDLRFEVISLLEADKGSDEILEQSAFSLFRQLIDNDISKLSQFNETLDIEIKRFPQQRTRQSLRDYLVDKWKYQKVFCMAITAFLFLVSGFVFQYIKSENNKQIKLAQNQPIKSIAVLPFLNDSSNQENEYLSDGITESIISRLARQPELSVRARNSVFQYKGKTINPQTTSKELSVQSLLLGRVIEYGNNLTISLELIDGMTGNQIWSNQYSRTTSSLISLQNEILRDVLNKLQTNTANTEKNKLDKFYTENAEAYQLYLKGRFYWNKRTASDLQKSIEFFDQAIARDPNFALAYSGLADSYVLFSGYGVSTPRESFPKAKESAKKALEIDETVAEAHAALGYVLFNYNWEFEQSEQHMKRALELNPNNATAHNWYGNANLLAVGRFDEAIEELQKAQSINPLSPITNADLGNSYLFARRTDQAIEQFQKTVAMDESFYYAHAYLGRAYMMKGLFNEALLELQKAQSLSNDPRVLMLMVCNYSRMGRKDQALSVLAQMNNVSKQRYVSAYYFALAYTSLGKKDEAFDWLEKAYWDHEGRMTLIKVDPLLDELRSDSRFKELVQRIGLD